MREKPNTVLSDYLGEFLSKLPEILATTHGDSVGSGLQVSRKSDDPCLALWSTTIRLRRG